MSRESPQLCAQALQRERPQLFEPTAGSDGQIPQPLNQQTRDMAALRFANGMVFFIISSTTAAEFYGKQIDRLNASNSVAALAVANCLVAYVEACDVPFATSEGGFRRYFSAYLILRKSMSLFGFLEPWEKFIAENKNDNGMSPSAGFQDDVTEILMKFPPTSEHAVVERVLQGLTHFKNSLGLIPGPVASMTLQVALDEPQRLMTGLWTGGSPDPPPSDGRCTFCGGSGKRSSCSACNGTGRVTRMNFKGEVEITTCGVCYGAGRARCDMCLGTGRR